MQVRIQGRQASGKQLGRLLNRLLMHVILPCRRPGLETVAGDSFVRRINVQTPLQQLQPECLQLVEFDDFNGSDVGPGSVDKGVVVEKFAAQDQCHCEQSVDLVVTTLDSSGKSAHTIIEVVQAEQDRCCWQARRRENLMYPFAELRRSRLSKLKASCHVNISQADGGEVVGIHGSHRLTHKIRHVLHFIIEMSRDTAGSLLLFHNLALLISRSLVLLFLLLKPLLIVVGEGQPVVDPQRWQDRGPNRCVEVRNRRKTGGVLVVIGLVLECRWRRRDRWLHVALGLVFVGAVVTALALSLGIGILSVVHVAVSISRAGVWWSQWQLPAHRALIIAWHICKQQ